MNVPVSSEALDIAFHPSEAKQLLATGLISGKVQLIDVDRSPNAAGASKKEKPYVKLWTVRPSNKSCRGIAFSYSGDSIFAISKDAAISRLDTRTGQVVNTWSKAHEAAPSRVLSIDENLLATGDDDGVVALWDPRQGGGLSQGSKPVRSYTHHFDWITSMLWCEHLSVPKKPKLSREDEEKKKAREEKKRKRKDKQRRRAGKGAASDSDEEDSAEDEDERRANASSRHRERLVITSGDGTLSVIDPRAGQTGVEVSEDQEDELLSIASVKHDSKLVVGTQLGILSLWAPTKGLLDHVDRIPGHPSSVDAMCTLDDDTILTGSSDGLVRVVQILPHKLLGVVADHEGMPVERLARHGSWLASIGHGSEIKLTDLGPLLDDGDDEDEDDVEVVPFGISTLSGEANEDEVEDGSEEDDDGVKEADSDDSGEARQDLRAAKKSKIEKVLRPVTQTVEDASAADFFADL